MVKELRWSETYGDPKPEVDQQLRWRNSDGLVKFGKIQLPQGSNIEIQFPGDLKFKIIIQLYGLVRFGTLYSSTLYNL